ncbi:MAG: hypothetical protein WD770_02240 [Actinomycetota bacterium]
MPRDRPPEDDVASLHDRLEPAPPEDPSAARARRRSRLLRRGLLITALVAGLAGGALFVNLRSKATPVSVEDSVDRFRDASGDAPAVAGLAAPGVYVYATSGGDAVTLLGGSRHDYPAETTLTVTPVACGASMRWDLLGERWEEWTICLDEGRRLIRSIASYHRFFGRSDLREYVCGAESLFHPPRPLRQRTWASVCRGSGTEATASGSVTGVEYLSVRGTRVRTFHLRIVTTFEGDTRGTRETEIWLAADTGLPILTVQSDDLDTNTPLGDTHYVEELRLELRSLQPRT